MKASSFSRSFWRSTQGKCEWLISSETAPWPTNQRICTAVLSLCLLSFSGAPGAANAAAALTGILLLFVTLPVLLLLTAATLLWRFPLGEREHLLVRRRIAGRA